MKCFCVVFWFGNFILWICCDEFLEFVSRFVFLFECFENQDCVFFGLGGIGVIFFFSEKEFSDFVEFVEVFLLDFMFCSSVGVFLILIDEMVVDVVVN